MISSSGDDIRKRMEIWQDILKVFLVFMVTDSL